VTGAISNQAICRSVHFGQMLQYRVDGNVTAALLSRKQLETIESAHIPVIFFNRTLPEVLVSSVR